MAWINMTDPQAVYSIAACYGSYNGLATNAYFQFYTYGGLNARVIQKTDANYIGRSTDANLATGWHFVAFTWSGGTNSSSIMIYLDGIRTDNADNQHGTFSSAYAGSDIPFVIGGQLSAGAGFTAPFFGREKDVRMYNRALSQLEIGTIFANESQGLPLTNVVLTGVSLSGTSLLLNGENGQAGATYSVLMSTNLSRPMNQWTPVATNLINANGNFSFTLTNAMNINSPQRFFILKTQ
jgi:hypothetical protein